MVNFFSKETRQLTGNQLRELLRYWHSRLDVVVSQFDENFYYFEGEDFISPLELAKQFQEAEMAIAELECVQQKFNLSMLVSVGDGEMILAEAIKRIGSVSRIAKIFKSHASGKKKERWDRERDRERSKESEYALPTLSKEEAMKEFTKHNRMASQLRTAIAEGNSKTMVFDVSVGLVDVS